LFKSIQLFFSRLKYKTFFSVSSFFRTDEQQELLKKVTLYLLVWENSLVNISNGEKVTLESTRSEHLALAAEQLIKSDKKKKQAAHIALLLPPSEFVATEHQLPNIAPQNITAALKYQVETLLPGYPRSLLLSCYHNESIQSNIALWFDQPRANQLYDAFKAHQLELVSIIPRTMLVTLTDKSTNKLHKSIVQQITEVDRNGQLNIIVDNQSLIQWSYISQDERQETDYYEQWLASLKKTDNDSEVTIEQGSFYESLDCSHTDKLHYTFFPDTARNNLKQRSRLKKGRLVIIGCIILALLAAAPFVRNSVRYNKYEKKYLDYKEKTFEVRKMRASVNQFEDNWALYLEYPTVNAGALINKLNKITPKNSWLSVFELKDNKIEIEGNSPNAAGLLDVISKQKEYEQVAFNQRTRSERGNAEHFGISFRIKNNTIDAYREKFLSEQSSYRGNTGR